MQENLDIFLPGRSNCCHVDQIPFNEGDEIVSFLDDELNRIDCCKDCWGKKTNKGKIFWKWIIPKKKTKIPPPDFQALEYFKNYCEEEDLSSLKKRFILAMYLERKKQMVLRKKDKKTHTLYFEILSSGQISVVKEVAIFPQEADEILSELVACLKE
ncbi:MAG: hypothetical protein KDK55_05410 [Chlamydiia bacterium]|nr:hypothetical protein [Chlamydiia bacterium]